MRRKPAKRSRVELLRSSIHGTTMTRKRYLSENHFSRIVGAKPLGLLEGNVRICESVHQKNRNEMGPASNPFPASLFDLVDSSSSTSEQY
jgi:hypothetical protein